MRSCERLRLTAKGHHEHDSLSKSVRFVVGISHSRGCVLCVPYEKLTGTGFAAIIMKHLPQILAGKASKLVLQDNCPVQNSAPARQAFAALSAYV